MTADLQFDFGETEVLYQAADQPEIGANGGLLLEGVRVGRWRATLQVVDDAQTYAVIQLSHSQRDTANAAWEPLNDLPSSDVNVLCLVGKSAFPTGAAHEPWWKDVVARLSLPGILGVPGGIVVSGTDGVAYPTDLGRLAGEIVAVRIVLPQA